MFEKPDLGRFRFPFFVVGEQGLGGLLAVIPFMVFGGFSGLFGGSSGGDGDFVFLFGPVNGGSFSGVLQSQKLFCLSLFNGLIAGVLVVLDIAVWQSKGSGECLCLLRHDPTDARVGWSIDRSVDCRGEIVEISKICLDSWTASFIGILGALEACFLKTGGLCCRGGWMAGGLGGSRARGLLCSLLQGDWWI